MEQQQGRLVEQLRGEHPGVDGKIQDVASVGLCHEEKLHSILLLLFGVVDFDGQSTLICQQPLIQ